MRYRPLNAQPGEFTIGELAREFGVTLRTLRFYEDRGLITPRREAGARLYSARDRMRLAAVFKARALGFTLSEIEAMLATEERHGSASGLHLSLQQVDDQIAHLERRLDETDKAIQELHRQRKIFSIAS